MNAYYLTFAEKDLAKDEARQKNIAKKLNEIEERQKKRRQFIEEIKTTIAKLQNHG
jgi:septal ring factor EnvC (AmiA/AmiB activator)